MECKFMPEDVQWIGAPGKTLMEMAHEAGIEMDKECAGTGTCGKCKVTVIDGAGKREVLACQHRPEADLMVELPKKSEKVHRKAGLLHYGTIPAPDMDVKEEAPYGIAFDVGTTTIAAFLWDLRRGEQLAACAEANPQGVYGADVISRILYASEGEENLKTLQEKVVSRISELSIKLCSQTGIEPSEIGQMTFAGNTTMCHLLMGVNPASLARAPFTPEFCHAISGKAKDIGDTVCGESQMYLMPCIAGHVGSDITAGLLAIDSETLMGNHLLLDVGTNGEMVLMVKGSAACCSCAAGPAFEGASIFQGMRAASGAIETVLITEKEVKVKVIGQTSAIGICGSGVIDAVSELLRTEIVDKTGRIASSEKLAGRGFSAEICGRIKETDAGRVFVLAHAEGQDIVITQKDIREVQLAKGAIKAGMEILMEHFSIQKEDIDRLYIAGAFGSHIDEDSAVRIGLFPDIPKERIVSVGNAAGTGACFSLISGKKRECAERVASGITHIELSLCPDFQDKYINAMMF